MDPAYSTQKQRLTMLKVFFSFAEAQGWSSKSPVSGIRPPKSDSPPAMPLSADEVRAMLRAAESKPKEKALLLPLRYSGLATGNAARLERSALRYDGELILRRAKTGEVVTVLPPPRAIIAVDAIAEPSRRHYFWTGQSLPSTVPFAVKLAGSEVHNPLCAFASWWHSASVAKQRRVAPNSGAAPIYGPTQRITDPLHLEPTDICTLSSAAQSIPSFML